MADKQDIEVARQLLDKYLVWIENKQAEDQKKLGSILKAWGAK